MLRKGKATSDSHQYRQILSVTSIFGLFNIVTVRLLTPTNNTWLFKNVTPGIPTIRLIDKNRILNLAGILIPTYHDTIASNMCATSLTNKSSTK